MAQDQPLEDSIRFIEDGHRLAIWWDKGELLVNNVICPNEGKVGFCNRGRDYCVVERFVGVFGSEVNIGSVEIVSPLEVAWVPTGGPSDLDTEFSQIWLVPVDDREYKVAKSMKSGGA